MQQSNFLFVTGFATKPDILKRDYSFLHSSQQDGQQEVVPQNRKSQVDFVQRNKAIPKLKKNADTPILKSYTLNKQQQQHIIPKRIQISKKMNQSVAFDEDNSQEFNSEVLKLSQSFDLNIVKAKKILRRIVPQNQIPPRSYSSMDKFIIEEQSENQTKFRSNYLTFEQDKENQDQNFHKQQEGPTQADLKQKQDFNERGVFANNNNSLEMQPSIQFSNMGINGDSHNKIGIKCVSQPDLDEIDKCISQNDLQKEQEGIQKQQQKLSVNKKGRVLSTTDIVQDSYFSQDYKKESENRKHTQNLIEDAKKKCPDIRNIVNQTLGAVPQVDLSDISLKPYSKHKTIKIVRKSAQMEYNLIDAYNQQNIQSNSQIILNKTSAQMHQSAQQNLLSNKSSNNQHPIKQQRESYSTNNNINNDEEKEEQNKEPVQNNKQTFKSPQNHVSFEALIKNEEERIRGSKLRERIDVKSNEQSNQHEQQLQLQEKVNQQNQIDSEISTIGGTAHSKQNSQLSANYQHQQQSIYQQHQSNSNSEGEVSSSSSQPFKQNQRVISRNYDYQIGVKNPLQMNEKLLIQHQIYTQSPSNPILSTHATSITDKSSKSISSNPKALGQLKQNLVLFYNNKKKEVNVVNNKNNLSQVSSSFQMETVQESGFQPHNSKLPFKQNQKQIICLQQMPKKVNLNNSQILASNMNSYLDVSTSSGRVQTEPSHQQDGKINNSYTPLSMQKKGHNNQIRNSQPKNFNNFLEEFNLDNIQIGPNKQVNSNNSKNRRSPQQLTYLIEVNSKTGATPLSQQNKQNSVKINSRNNGYSNSNVAGQNSKINQIQQGRQSLNQNQIKSRSSMGFNDNTDQRQQDQSQHHHYHNIISHPPLLTLSQTQDNSSEISNSTKNFHSSIYGNTMPISNSNQSRKSGGTGGHNMIFEFHEVKQQQPYNQRSLSQQSTREQYSQKNFNISDTLEQGGRSLSQQSQQNHNSIYQFQNFQPSSLNFAPPSCSSAQSNYNSSTNHLNSKLNKLNQSIGTLSSKNNNNAGYFNPANIMREMYTELDEDVRIFDFSPKIIQALKQNQMQKSTLLSSSSLLDFNNTNMSASLMSRTNAMIPNSGNNTDFKKFNEITKVCLGKLEQTIQPSETNTIINQYLDQARSRITQLKNKKKNAELDLIILNSKIVSSIEGTNNDFKQKLMPHHLNQQLEELYQSIKKNIFIYSCQ